MAGIFTADGGGKYDAANHYAYGGYFILGGNIDANGAAIASQADAWITGQGKDISTAQRGGWGFQGTSTGRGLYSDGS